MTFRYPKDVIVQVCTGSTWDSQGPAKAHERFSERRHTPHFALLAVFAVQDAQRSFSCLFVVLEAHVGWKLQGHLAYMHVSWALARCFESHVPKGPTISSIFGSSVIVTPCFRLAGGSRILRSTPCGVDNGALPIRDRHLSLLENGLDVCDEDTAGTRKSGSKIETLPGVARRQFDLSFMTWTLYFIDGTRTKNARSEVNAQPR